ncbi:MAG TPA: hypothetical protein VLA75_10010 [Thermoanaerobaculia bacterium]|nr:hypothetical protein [Thermoanaerobaculia bacterium]
MDRGLILQALVGSVAGLLAAAATHFLRGFPWSLAAIVGVAVAVLVGTALATAERLVRLWRGPTPPAPGEDD